MSSLIQGVWQIRTKHNNNLTTEIPEKNEDLLKEHFDENMRFLSGSVNNPDRKDHTLFAFSIDTHMFGIDPLGTALDAIGACDGCLGAMFIEYDPIGGKFHFFFSDSVPQPQRRQWRLEYIARNLDILTKTLNEELKVQNDNE